MVKSSMRVRGRGNLGRERGDAGREIGELHGGTAEARSGERGKQRGG